ncbi:MAG: hypothetical protein EAX91_04560 [Candidatus Lokiarchaeota archaeon]|nr:hypothetical protein [Candidatus Lokiarchaeota archaeon]
MLLIISSLIYDLLIFVWEIFIEFYWVVILLSGVGIGSLVIGGIKLQYNAPSWIVLIGVILIFISLILASLFMSLGGILLSYVSIPMILVVIGLVCIVVAGLIREK